MTLLAAANCVLVVGPSDAGKSNFLFRFWIALNSGTGLLVKDGLPPVAEYLRTGADELLKGQFAGHTSKAVHERLSIPIKHGEQRGVLMVPDVAGEQILSIYKTRRWSQEWESLLAQSGSCLLFVRAGSDQIVPAMDWATAHHYYGAVPAAGGAPKEGKSGSPATPTQVVLVDWLQFLRRAFTDVRGGAYRPKLGVIVSAWDAVPGDQQAAGPSKYIQDNFPLLSQFLDSNEKQFEVAYFGVSATGGDFKNDTAFRKQYLDDPQGHGYVVFRTDAGQQQTVDMTLPVAWALGVVPSVV